VVGIDIETMKAAFRIRDWSAPHVVKYGPRQKHVIVICMKVTGIAIIDPVGQKLVKFIGIQPAQPDLLAGREEALFQFVLGRRRLRDGHRDGQGNQALQIRSSEGEYRPAGGDVPRRRNA
jgi:hypothetical protein